MRMLTCGYGCILEPVYESLAEELEGLDPPEHTEALLGLVAAHERLGAVLCRLTGHLDAAGAWAADGSSSMVAWLRHHARLSAGDAARLVRTAERLRAAPVTSSAYRSGQLSAGQVQAVVANVSRKTAELYAGHEAELVPALAPLSVADTSRAMAAWRAGAEAVTPGPPPPPEDVRELHLSRSLGGNYLGRLALDPEGGQVLRRAVELALSPDAEGEPERSAARRRADALIDICRAALEAAEAPASGARQRPHIEAGGLRPPPRARTGLRPDAWLSRRSKPRSARRLVGAAPGGHRRRLYGP